MTAAGKLLGRLCVCYRRRSGAEAVAQVLDPVGYSLRYIAPRTHSSIKTRFLEHAHMPKNTNRTPAILLAIALVLVTSPELLALVLTVQAIGVETVLLLIACQARCVTDGVSQLFSYLFFWINSLLRKLAKRAAFLLYLAPKPDHPIVLRQLTLLLGLQVRVLL